MYVLTSHNERNVHVPLDEVFVVDTLHVFLCAGIKWGLLVNFGPTFFAQTVQKFLLVMLSYPLKMVTIP